MKDEKIIVALLVAICLISTIAIGTPKTTAKNESSKEPKFRRSDNPILHLPVDEEKWLPIVPPEPVGRPLDEDAEQDIELLIYDVKTKKTKKILKNFTKSDKTTLKLPGSQGSLPSELVPESVFPPDNRVLISPTTDYPWRTICKLWMYFPSSGWSMGSGFIIDNYHVLTAGHCVYDPALAEWATFIEVIPALDGGYSPFYHAWTTRWVVNSYWFDYGWSTDDFAILTLDRNVGAFIGWMGLEYADPSNSIYTGILNTAGYPGDLDGGWNMYFDSDLGAGADEYNHWYYMDTYGGQSGSPVWYYDGTYRYVLSIHTYGTGWPLYPNSNMGNRLSEYWFSFINDVREGDTPPIDYANLIDDGQLWSGFEPTTVVPGETSFGVWSDMRNIGTAASGVFYVSYYASIDAEITDSDYLIRVDEVPSITPFTWVDSDWSGTFPNIPAGTYYVGWIIDSTDIVPEPLDNGEDNNVAYKDSYQLTVLAHAPQVTLSFTEGPVGSVVEVNGTVFTPAGNVTSIMINDTVCTIIDTIDINGEGNFTGSFVIPSVYTTGVYEINVTDSGGRSAAVDFRVVGLSKIAADPDYGAPGEEIEVTGFNFTSISGEDVRVTLGGIEIQTFKTDENGEFYGTFIVPALPFDVYTLKAEQAKFNINSTKSFKVCLIVVMVSPSEGPTGTKGDLAGVGFTAGGMWNATFGDTAIFVDEGVAPDGTISGAFYVPTVNMGVYTVTVLDIDTEMVATTEFEVNSTTTLTIDPAFATSGYNMTIEGLFFAAKDGSALDFVLKNSTHEWDINNDVKQGNPGTAAVLNDYGNFTAWWVVPQLDNGTYTISVTDSEGLHTQTIFYIGYTAFNPEIYEDWNLVGIPLVLVDPTMEGVFAENLIHIESIYGFYNSSWSYWLPGAPSTLHELEYGHGYWVLSTSNFTINMIGFPVGMASFIDGWNLIGINDTSPVSLEEFFAGDLSKVRYVYGYRAGGWTYYIKGIGGGLDILYPGEGYWVYCETG